MITLLHQEYNNIIIRRVNFMVQYCRKCGAEIDDDSKFCEKCGFSVGDDPTKEKTEPKDNTITDNKTSETDDKNKFIKRLPLIVSAIAIIMALFEGLGTPMLMGWTSILMAIGVGVVGGIIGILLMEKLNEPLIAAVEFIGVGAIIFMFIGRFGEISAILFIIAAIITLYFKGLEVINKKLWIIPVITVVGIFLILILGGALYQINAQNSVTVGNLTQNISNNGYGYYSGYVTGDIKVDSKFDYLAVHITYYDKDGKVIHSRIGWNDLNPENGRTYKISDMYFDKTQPVKAEIKVVDSAKSDRALYTENITLS